MEAAPIKNIHSKMSFAKVAASGYQFHKGKENTPLSSSSPKHSETASPDASRNGFAIGFNPSDLQAKCSGMNTSRTHNGVSVEQRHFILKPNGRGNTHELPLLLKAVNLDDHSNTQLSASDTFTQNASVEGKSATTATTYALDEKDSLRPDDSASIKAAAEEEDPFSGSGSTAAGSRFGSDTGARAFQDQLHGFEQIVPLTIPEPKSSNGHFVVPGGGSVFTASLAPNEGQVGSVPVPVQSQLSLFHSHPTPDDKLFEALASQTDRLFVMKLEQDIIDFIKHTSDQMLNLPQCNSFYRLLAHRLADYYMLGHVLDPTQSAVQLHRTPYCQLPPPLSTLPNPFVECKTPPPTIPARKIMRRIDDGMGQSDNSAPRSDANELKDSSKPASEKGGDSASDEGRISSVSKKDPSTMTREEREARYNAARDRIFRDFREKEPDGGDGSAEGDEKDISRTSSVTGKRKLRKQRNNDDDFEARSQFSPIYPYNGSNSADVSGFPLEASISDTYSRPDNSQQTGLSYYPAAQQFHGSYVPTFPQGGLAGYPWNADHFAEGNDFNFTPHSPTQGLNNGYNLVSAAGPDYQSFQELSMQQQFPAMSPHNYGMYGGTSGPAITISGHGWPQGVFDGSYGYTIPPFDNGRSQRLPPPMDSNGTPGYGQLTPLPFQTANMVSMHNARPMPGSYQRPGFNPQSRDFVPANNVRQVALPHPSPSMASKAAQDSMAMQRQSSSRSYSSGLASSHISHSSPTSFRGNGQNTSSTQTVNGQASQSSLSKWGTPAHLPPKPPPSNAPMQLPMHRDSQHALPPHVPPTNGRFPGQGKIQVASGPGPLIQGTAQF